MVHTTTEVVGQEKMIQNVKKFKINKTVIFHPLVGRFRGKNGGISVGNDLQPFDYQRLHVKSSFEYKDYVVNLDVQESIFDYIFYKFGVDTKSIDHPILLTECPFNPIQSRKALTELLFECYKIPSLCFGVDSLFSFKKNVNQKNGLILSSGFNSTFVLPYVDGVLDSNNSRK
jgi:actin-related protein 5